MNSSRYAASKGGMGAPWRFSLKVEDMKIEFQSICSWKASNDLSGVQKYANKCRNSNVEHIGSRSPPIVKEPRPAANERKIQKSMYGIHQIISDVRLCPASNAKKKEKK